MTNSELKNWMVQWKSACLDLAAERFKDLHNMSPKEGNRRVRILFSGFKPDHLSEERQKGSGFVEMQRYFKKWKP